MHPEEATLIQGLPNKHRWSFNEATCKHAHSAVSLTAGWHLCVLRSLWNGMQVNSKEPNAIKSV